MRFIFLAVLSSAFALKSPAQIEYPYPVHYLHLTIENKPLQMAYMNVSPAGNNGKTIILFHGKNFNGYYWKNVIPMLTEKGYRVIVPTKLAGAKATGLICITAFKCLQKTIKYC